LPFDVNIDIGVIEFKIETTDLKCNSDLKNVFQYARLVDFIVSDYVTVSWTRMANEKLFQKGIFFENSLPEI
jgi:hypothetical protein